MTSNPGMEILIASVIGFCQSLILLVPALNVNISRADHASDRDRETNGAMGPVEKVYVVFHGHGRCLVPESVPALQRMLGYRETNGAMGPVEKVYVIFHGHGRCLVPESVPALQRMLGYTEKKGTRHLHTEGHGHGHGHGIFILATHPEGILVVY
jgi:hypothetical protein